MGRDDDPLAVTTPQGRVRGVDGLRVCDASVMPSIPCANTNISTIMVAERMADLIKAGKSKTEDRATRCAARICALAPCGRGHR